MRVEGVQRIAALAPADVYRSLTDPDVLARCTPGLKEIERVGEGDYRVVLEIGVAAVKGRYEGHLRVLSPSPPDGFTLGVDVSGQSGFVRAEVPIALAAAEGGTELRYGGEAQVGGAVAGVGQRVLGGVAKWIVGQFFGALAREAAARRVGGEKA
ncbi:MAG: carbon monoxide dehydrogenase subunit G [Firmicutes bacterium]|nr:carbon monoxide dehydrogenase subunit G [Bacillota bacterium]